MREQTLNEHALQCMEIIGGNRALRQTIAAPGLAIWIDSRPLELGAGGGDVHYISTCGGGYVTRLAIADIAGHGESADGLAIILRKLMRKYINTLDQTRFCQNSQSGAKGRRWVRAFYASICCSGGPTAEH